MGSTQRFKGASWRGIGIGALILAPVVGLAWGALHLRLLYIEAEAIHAFSALGDGAVLVGERIHDGGEETGLSGGDRLVVIDVRTGDVRARKLVRGETLIGVFGAPPKIWTRERRGSLVTRAPGGADALSVIDPPEAHEARTPELAALRPGASVEPCFDARAGELRFTSTDGRRLAFALATEALRPEAAACGSPSVAVQNVTLEDGELLDVRTGAGSARGELVMRSPRAPVRTDAPSLGLDGLELSLVADTHSRTWPPEPLRVLGDVLATRRTNMSHEAPTELVRFDLRAGKIVWATTLHAERGHLERVLLLHPNGQEATILVQETQRLLGVDARTGKILWRRGKE